MSIFDEFEFQKQIPAMVDEPEEIIEAESWTPLDLHIPLLGLALLLIPVFFCALYYFGFAYIIQIPPFGPTAVTIGVMP
jgi:hypothetical protein